MSAGLSWDEAGCLVGDVTSRYGPYDYISETTMRIAAENCISD